MNNKVQMTKRKRDEESEGEESKKEEKDGDTSSKKSKKCDDDQSAYGYTFERKDAPEDLSISPIPTSKDKIRQPPLAEHEDMFIPPLGSSVVISGKSGSGKSTLLARLITDKRFYGNVVKKDGDDGDDTGTEKSGYFDKIFLFSPTANGDDVQKALGIDKKFVFTDLDEAPELLEVILDTQQEKLDGAEGADKVEQYAIIFDDVIGDTTFMNERSFTRCFYQVRHVNCTTFICTQHFKRVPKVCRLQANFVFFFQGSASEVEVVVEEFAPPGYTVKEMRQMINDATKGKYTFLTINMKVGWDKRFRRNLDEFIKLDRICEDEETPEKDKNKKKRKRKSKPAEKTKKRKYAHNGEEEDRLIKDTNDLIEKNKNTPFLNEWGANE